jgi:hypothetical protein
MLVVVLPRLATIDDGSSVTLPVCARARVLFPAFYNASRYASSMLGSFWGFPQEFD